MMKNVTCYLTDN